MPGHTFDTRACVCWGTRKSGHLRWVWYGWEGDGCATWPDSPSYKGAEYTATVKAEKRKKFADEMQVVRDRKFRAKWQDIYDNDQQDLY